MTDINRPFRVVTHKNWLADQFKPLGAVQDFGFDIDPHTALNTIWWAPGAWVASALKAGVHLPLMSCGPHWLDRLPLKYRGRKVNTTTLGAAMSLDPSLSDYTQLFIKLPEAKLDDFPARVHEYNRHWATTLAQYQLPPATLVQIQEFVEFHAEARFFIVHNRIVADSFYRIGDLIWGDPGFDQLADMVVAFHWLRVMADLAAEVAATIPAPPGYVLDIGVTTDGDPLVVEANAAWSSGPYDCNPAGVVEAITAAHDFEGIHPEWAWRPNPALYKAGPLKLWGNP